MEKKYGKLDFVKHNYRTLWFLRIMKSSQKNWIYCIKRNVMKFVKFGMNK